MGRRPLCMFGMAMILVCALLSAAGVPLMPESADLREAKRLLLTPRETAVEGIVDSYEDRGEYSVVVLRRAVMRTAAEGRADAAAGEADAASGGTAAAAGGASAAAGGASASAGGVGAAGTDRGGYTEKVLAVGKVRLLTPADSYRPCGCVLRAEGLLSRIAEAENPGEFDSAAYYALSGIYFQMRRPSVHVLEERTDVIREFLAGLRRAAGARIRETFPEDVSDILAAVLTGDRTSLSEETRSLWRSGGIMHMLAISGLHLSLIGMGLFRLLRRAHLPLKPAGLIAGGCILFYTVLIGCPLSAVRASVMFVMMISAQLVGRTYDPLTALAVAAVLILLGNPEALFYSGFQLSVCAVLLCILLEKRGKLLAALLLYMGMLPVTALTYAEIPLFSMPVNLLAVPLLPVILAGGAAGTLLGGAVAAGGAAAASAGAIPPAAWPVTMLLRGLTGMLERLRAVPFSTIVTGHPSFLRLAVYLAAFCLWAKVYLKWRLFKRRFFLLLFVPLLIGILAFPSYLLHPGQMKITFLAVGQGDSILLRGPSGETVLVDGGSTTAYEVGERRILPFLRFEGISRLDYVVATHMDEDHISGLAELMQLLAEGREHIRIGTVLMPYLKERDVSYENFERLAVAAGARVLHVQAGDRVTVGAVKLDVFCPDPDAEGSPPDANAQCIVLGVHYGSFDALLTGDTCGEGEASLLRAIKEDSCHYELLKVAHHGSRYSTPAEFLACVRPEISVISCGSGNRYGHPHEELMERLGDAGTEIFRTDRQGAVTVATDGSRFDVSTFRG